MVVKHQWEIKCICSCDLNNFIWNHVKSSNNFNMLWNLIYRFDVNEKGCWIVVDWDISHRVKLEWSHLTLIVNEFLLAKNVSTPWSSVGLYIRFNLDQEDNNPMVTHDKWKYFNFIKNIMFSNESFCILVCPLVYFCWESLH